MREAHSPLGLLGAIVTFLSGLSPTFADAPPPIWERSFRGPGDTIGTALQVTRDGGCIVAGNSELVLGVPLLSEASSLLVRTDGEGRQIWERRVRGPESRRIEAVVESADGGFVAAGIMYDAPEQADLYLLKVDAAGEILWERRHVQPGRQSCYSLIETSGGDLVLVGSTGEPNSQRDILLLRTDGAGAIRWQRTFGDPRFDDAGRAVVETADGELVAAGGSQVSGSGVAALYLFKTSRDGDLRWEKQLGGGHDAFAESVARTRDGGFIVAGRIYGRGAGVGDLYLIRTDGGGDPIWERTFGGSFDDWGTDAIETSSGDIVAVGSTVSFPADGGEDWTPRLYLVRVDAGGRKVWDQVYGDDSAGAAVREAPDGGYLVCGTLRHPEPEPGLGIYLFKRDPGSAQEARFVRGDANRDDSVDVSDAISVLDGLFFAEKPFPVCPDGADADDNGVLEITDAIHLVNFLFLGGPPPAAPFPQPGDDPSPDELDCHL